MIFDKSLDSSSLQPSTSSSTSSSPTLSQQAHFRTPSSAHQARMPGHSHLFPYDSERGFHSFPTEKLLDLDSSAAYPMSKARRRRWFFRAILIITLCLLSFFLFSFPPNWASRSKSTLTSFTNTSKSDLAQDQVDWDFAKKASIVFTWVNGSEPEYKAQRAKLGGKRAVDGDRDRDNGDLLFSLRALETNMPWHQGEVIIVSPSPPRWLNIKNKRVRWVDQNTIVPKRFQPTFNTNVIESFIHLIPGLTDRFIQINDDTMIAKPLEPNEFFTPDGGVRLFLENTVIKPPSIPVQKIWAGSVHRTARILKEVYANEETGEFENDPPRFLKHAPFVYWKRALEEIHEIFAEELAETYTHPFRNARDVITPLLHQTFLTQEGKLDGMPWSIASSSEAALLKWTTDLYRNADSLDETLDRDPAFITFNDELGHSSTSRDFKRAQKQLQMVYNELCGSRKSQFEI